MLTLYFAGVRLKQEPPLFWPTIMAPMIRVKSGLQAADLGLNLMAPPDLRLLGRFRVVHLNHDLPFQVNSIVNDFPAIQPQRAWIPSTLAPRLLPPLSLS